MKLMMTIVAKTGRLMEVSEIHITNLVTSGDLVESGDLVDLRDLANY